MKRFIQLRVMCRNSAVIYMSDRIIIIYIAYLSLLRHSYDFYST